MRELHSNIDKMYFVVVNVFYMANNYERMENRSPYLVPSTLGLVTPFLNRHRHDDILSCIQLREETNIVRPEVSLLLLKRSTQYNTFYSIG